MEQLPASPGRLSSLRRRRADQNPRVGTEGVRQAHVPALRGRERPAHRPAAASGSHSSRKRRGTAVATIPCVHVTGRPGVVRRRRSGSPVRRRADSSSPAAVEGSESTKTVTTVGGTAHGPLGDPRRESRPVHSLRRAIASQTDPARMRLEIRIWRRRRAGWIRAHLDQRGELRVVETPVGADFRPLTRSLQTGA